MRTITLRRDGQQGPPYTTGNYIQSPGINHSGKEFFFFNIKKRRVKSKEKAS